jgi:hypothetical protein
MCSPEGDYEMSKVTGKLRNCLERRKFLPIECGSIIKDIICFINNQNHHSITGLNQELEALGWGIDVADDDIYALAISLSANGSGRAPRLVSLKGDPVIQGIWPSVLDSVAA